MKAAVLFETKKPLSIEDIALRNPTSNEVVIRTAASGLCHSDLHFIDGDLPYPLPVVLGHEASGIVEMVGENVTYVKPGDHVITCLSVFCGVCDNCTTGRPYICADEKVKMLPGQAERLLWDRPEKLHTGLNLSGFAENMLVHENALVKIRKDMPLDRAAIIGCSIITGYGAIVNSAQVKAGESVAVLGCGGIGMAAVNTAFVAGAERIIAIDTNPEKLRLALKLGATHLVNPSDGDTVEQVKDITGGGIEKSIECLGFKSTAEQCFKMLKIGGTATIVGLLPQGVSIEVNGFDLSRERRLQGSWMGSNHFRVDMPRIVELYMQGRLKLDNWVTKKITLDQINEGFDSIRQGDGMRSVIDFNILGEF
ncbi:MAG: Zn-dependent alcohol dehydrogenase [Paracoccaceae bacterium]|nr:Zn-dependent alcohol dehydrogenase [Paracoccaceae bacterium]